MHLVRAHYVIALTALLLASLAPPALAQTDTPDFVEDWSKPPGEAADDSPPRSEAAPAAPAKREPEKPPSSVEVDEADTSEPKKSKTAPRNTVIEPYPQNPRCYVAGRYVAAPPLCPN